MVAPVLRRARRLRYSKAGMMITELKLETIRAIDPPGDLDRERRGWAWLAMNKMNATLRRDMSASSVPVRKNALWELRAEHRSPRWTTRSDELPRVRLC